MLLKDFWTGTSHWFRSQKLDGCNDFQPHIDAEGFLCPGSEVYIGDQTNSPSDSSHKAHDTIVKCVSPVDKRDYSEKLQDGFNQLILKLEGINEHLNQQITHQKEWMTQIEHLPDVLRQLPELIESQLKPLCTINV